MGVLHASGIIGFLVFITVPRKHELKLRPVPSGNAILPTHQGGIFCGQLSVLHSEGVVCVQKQAALTVLQETRMMVTLGGGVVSDLENLRRVPRVLGS